MDVEIPEVGIEVPSVSQVAWVVEDLEDAIERYSKTLGIGPWEVHYIEPPEHREMSYRGRETECAFAVGYATIDDIEIEFVEPLDGDSIHQDFLDEHGEGIHHLACFEFEEVSEVVNAFENAGIPVVQDGKWHDRHYMYFDTQEMLDGMYFETLTGGEFEPEPAETYLPETWS